MIGVPLAPRPIEAFHERHGGELRNNVRGVVRRLVPVARAGSGDLAPLLNARYIEEASAAVLRGALLLVDESLSLRPEVAVSGGCCFIGCHTVDLLIRGGWRVVVLVDFCTG